MTDEIHVFSCPPGKQATCEHVWDGPGVEFTSECRDCNGTGIRTVDGRAFTCLLCDGRGEYVSGDACTCSKCGMDAMTYSLWNDE